MSRRLARMYATRRDDCDYIDHRGRQVEVYDVRSSNYDDDTSGRDILIAVGITVAAIGAIALISAAMEGAA